VEKNHEEEFIFIAVSRIDVEEDMKRIKERNRYDVPPGICIKIPQKGIVIYRLKLEKSVNENANKSYKFDKDYHWNNLSGICRFVDDVDPNSTSKNNDPSSISEKNDDPDYILKKFIVFNFDGIYSFKYNAENRSFNQYKRYNYPNIFNNELKHFYTKEDSSDCMNRLLSCIYGKYFLVENARFIEGRFFFLIFDILTNLY